MPPAEEREDQTRTTAAGPASRGVVPGTRPRPPASGASTPGEAPRAADPVLGNILRQARLHNGFSLRGVEQRTRISNAHLAQIEKGAIKRPDPALLMELCELYDLDYRLIAEWAGYLDQRIRRTSGPLAGLALRLFVELDPITQREAIEFLGQLRDRQRGEGQSSDPREAGSP